MGLLRNVGVGSVFYEKEKAIKLWRTDSEQLGKDFDDYWCELSKKDKIKHKYITLRYKRKPKKKKNYGKMK